MIGRIELLSNETINGCSWNRLLWKEESEAKYGHIEIEVIIHPSKDFSRNMECMSLEFGKEVTLENTHFL